MISGGPAIITWLHLTCEIDTKQLGNDGNILLQLPALVKNVAIPARFKQYSIVLVCNRKQQNGG